MKIHEVLLTLLIWIIAKRITNKIFELLSDKKIEKLKTQFEYRKNAVK